MFPGGFHDFESWWLFLSALIWHFLFHLIYSRLEWQRWMVYNARYLKVNDGGRLLAWVGCQNSPPSSFIPPSFQSCSHSLVHKNLVKCAASWRWGSLSILGWGFSTQGNLYVLPSEGFRARDCIVHLKHITNSLAFLPRFRPSPPSSVALCCVKIPSDWKQVETNYNVLRTIFSFLTHGIHLSCRIFFFFSTFAPFNFKLCFNQTWTVPAA